MSVHLSLFDCDLHCRFMNLCRAGPKIRSHFVLSECALSSVFFLLHNVAGVTRPVLDLAFRS